MPQLVITPMQPRDLVTVGQLAKAHPPRTAFDNKFVRLIEQSDEARREAGGVFAVARDAETKKLLGYAIGTALNDASNDDVKYMTETTAAVKDIAVVDGAEFAHQALTDYVVKALHDLEFEQVFVFATPTIAAGYKDSAVTFLAPREGWVWAEPDLEFSNGGEQIFSVTSGHGAWTEIARSAPHEGKTVGVAFEQDAGGMTSRDNGFRALFIQLRKLPVAKQIRYSTAMNFLARFTQRRQE
jgi:hypothetical protein